MLPIILQSTRIAVAGAGEGLARRRNFLAAAGVRPELLPATSSSERLAPFAAVFVAGLSRSRSVKLAAAARDAGVLVNVEDEPELCDFFVPAVVRRGDLLISVSTSGKSPGLARLIKQWIEDRVPSSWAARLVEASAHRAIWHREGADPALVARKTAELVDQRGWLT